MSGLLATFDNYLDYIRIVIYFFASLAMFYFGTSTASKIMRDNALTISLLMALLGANLTLRNSNELYYANFIGDYLVTPVLVILSCLIFKTINLSHNKRRRKDDN